MGFGYYLYHSNVDVVELTPENFDRLVTDSRSAVGGVLFVDGQKLLTLSLIGITDFDFDFDCKVKVM